jgi:hypothetical protein
MSLLEAAQGQKETVLRSSNVIELADKSTTTVHTVQYVRSAYIPRLVKFDRATRLLDWCEASQVAEAIVGGFFMRATDELLGETWLGGERHPHVPVPSPWDKMRGSVHIDAAGNLSLALRHQLPKKPQNDLLQAGPLLVQNGASRIVGGLETEGVSLSSHQFDSDITDGRYPRAAIGINDEHIFSLVCDGRSDQDAGMTLSELADYMIQLGANEALNLDGGSSASLVSGGSLLNRARGDDVEYLRGRPIYTALAFEPLKL